MPRVGLDDPDLLNTTFQNELANFIADYETAWYAARNVVETRILLGEQYLWQLQDPDRAEAVILPVLSGYPAWLDQYPLAKASLRLGNVYLDRAWTARKTSTGDAKAYLSKANAYGEEIRRLVWAGGDANLSEAESLFTGFAQPAFLAVRNLRGLPNSILDNEALAANAYHDEASLARDIAWVLQDNGADTTVTTPRFQLALDLFGQLSWSNFPNLPEDEWYFFEALRGIPQIQNRLGEFTLARDGFVALLDLITAPGAYWSWREAEVLRELADTYYVEALRLPDSQTRIDLFQAAIAQFDCIAGMVGSVEDKDSIGWGLVNRNWSYINMIYTMVNLNGWTGSTYNLPLQFTEALVAVDELAALKDVLVDKSPYGCALQARATLTQMQRYLTEAAGSLTEADRILAMNSELAAFTAVVDSGAADNWIMRDAR